MFASGGGMSKGYPVAILMCWCVVCSMVVMREERVLGWSWTSSSRQRMYWVVVDIEFMPASRLYSLVLFIFAFTFCFEPIRGKESQYTYLCIFWEVLTA